MCGHIIFVWNFQLSCHCVASWTNNSCTLDSCFINDINIRLKSKVGLEFHFSIWKKNNPSFSLLMAASNIELCVIHIQNVYYLNSPPSQNDIWLWTKKGKQNTHKIFNTQSIHNHKANEECIRVSEDMSVNKDKQTIISMHLRKPVTTGQCYDMAPDIRQSITNQRWLKSIDTLY